MPCGTPSFLFSGYRGIFPRWEGGRCMKLTIHVHLVQNLRMSGAIPPLPHTLSTGTFTFTLHFSLLTKWNVLHYISWCQQKFFYTIPFLVIVLCRWGASVFCCQSALSEIRSVIIMQWFRSKVKVKLSLCFNWAPRHEGVLEEWRYSSILWPRH
jgi:hypothetical protein